MTTENAQHTRAPWLIEELHGSSMQTSTGSRCVALITAGGVNIADVCDSAGITEAEARANAHLIAAAPDLSAALKAEDDLVVRAQRILGMYLEPGERRVQTAEQCVAALLALLDGPDQRIAQSAARAALAKADPKAQS